MVLKMHQRSYQVIHSLDDNLCTDILDLQLIVWDTPENSSRPHWLVPTIELIKYSFVVHYQYGGPKSQELRIK